MVSKFIMTPFTESVEPGLDDVQFQYGGQLPEADDVQQPAKKVNAIRARAIEKATKSAKIMSRLARINGYNDSFEIKTRDGSYLSGSNMILLIWHVLTPAREVSGLKEFVQLLHDAGVDPSWIDNPNVRSTLSSLTRVPQVERATSPVPEAQPELTAEPPPPVLSCPVSDRRRK